MGKWKYSDWGNIQHPTPNIQLPMLKSPPSGGCWMLVLGIWSLLLDVFRQDAMKLWAMILAVGIGIGSATAAGLRATPQRDVAMIEIKGEITPTTAGYVSRAIDLAAERNNSCLIIRINTPGGLLDSTQKITEKFFASPVPVVVYVAPKGAMA